MLLQSSPSTSAAMSAPTAPPPPGGECPPHLAGLRYRATEAMWPYSDDESSSRPVGMASVSERAAPSRKYSGKRLETQTRAANGMNRV